MRAAQFVERTTADQSHARTIGLRERAVTGAPEHSQPDLLEQPVTLRSTLVELFVTFGDCSGESGQRGSMLARQTVERVLKVAASVLECALGFATFCSEPTDLGVCRRLGLLDALAQLSMFGVETLRHFGETTLVFESLVSKLGLEVCLLLESARAEGVGLLAVRSLGFQSG
jgi:hypothetical protein